jgi:L-alanine-DL-glutamate epimerase-like enolase superfamily enzyme
MIFGHNVTSSPQNLRLASLFLSHPVKITSFEEFKVPPRWLFLKIEMDDGVTGWGEPIMEGKAGTVRAAVAELMESGIWG